MTAVSKLLADRYGLRVDGSTASRLRRLLRTGAERAGIDDGGYERLLQGEPAELEWLMERLTVQETQFFRHPAHFDAVGRRVVPGGGGVVWSAGCANGQEAWSLAMLMEERGALGWSVLGTDVSGSAVARATDGRYTARELRGLSPERRERFLRQVDDDLFEVHPSLRSRVRFARHNLATDPPPPDADGRVVLCRNVLIYLRRRAADRFLARLRQRMPTGGLLLLGAAESLPAGHPSFAARRIPGGYGYEPRVEDPVPIPAPESLRRPRRGHRPHRSPQPARLHAPLPDARELIADGEAHAAAGRHRDAAVAFRKAIYLRPHDGLAQARLAFALEASGDERGARRAFRAARRSLAESEPVNGDLHGWSLDELRRVVAERAERADPAGDRV